MKNKVLIFGGTTEGRELALLLDKVKVPHAVSVATDYGKEIEESFGEHNIIVGRKDADEMAQLIASENFTVCVDATHPFATIVSGEIAKACEKSGIRYLRLLRETAAECEAAATVVDSVETAAAELDKTPGNILLLTGSKDLKTIVSGLSDISRVYARVLPNVDSISKCEEAGLRGRQIIAMQGPFSKDMNIALIKEISADVILTKESGSTGGLDEKLLAARECGIKAVMIKSPGRSDGAASEVEGYSLDEILKALGVNAGATGAPRNNSVSQGKADSVAVSKAHATGVKKRIILAGIGPGEPRYYTKELEDALKDADVIFGAKSVLDRAYRTGLRAHFEPLYKGEDILEFLEGAARKGDNMRGVRNGGAGCKYSQPLALFSGDISLCSGAKKAAEVFEKAGYEVYKISGISSVSLFAGRLGLGLEECDVISAHGRECNVAGYAARCKKLFVLPSSCGHAREIAKGIFRAVNGDVKIIIGYELGTRDERLFEVRSDNLETALLSDNEKGKCLMYIDNNEAERTPVLRALTDDMFIRGNTPMTKEEIRAISVRKLSLCADSVLYDVGAGTGSVSVEAALLHPDIKVYSIEKDADAVELLEKNKEKFSADNITVVRGTAPEAMKDLPAPTHAFIGGSGGNLREILELLKQKNPEVRIVINCVTLETFTQVLELAKTGDYGESDIVQVSACRYKKAGNYHLADAINPVYVVKLG